MRSSPVFRFSRFLPGACLLPALLLPAIALADNVQVQVTDAAGQPLADAVIYAEPASGPQVLKTPRRAEIEQKGRRYLPLVTVVQTGSEISFPNRDTVRHHVYSYSTAKTFDIKLYAGGTAPVEVFDKAGLVILGCNIHDAMVAYIQVVSTPWFGKTGTDGKVKLEGLASGSYRLKAWHPGLPLTAAPAEQALTLAGADGNASFRLNTK